MGYNTLEFFNQLDPFQTLAMDWHLDWIKEKHVTRSE